MFKWPTSLVFAITIAMVVMAWPVVSVAQVVVPASKNAADKPPTTDEEPGNGPSSVPEPSAADSAPVDPALGSPSATMNSFLLAMTGLWDDPEAWDRAVRCLDFSAFTEADAERQRALARQLYGILNRIELIDVKEMPDAEQVRATEPASYRFFPRRPEHDHISAMLSDPLVGHIVLARMADGTWKFNAQTVKAIPLLFEQMKDLPSVAGKKILTPADWIESLLPEALVHQKLLTLKYWQWLGLLLLSFLAVVLDFSVRMVLRMLSRGLIRRQRTEAKSQTITGAVRPVGLLAGAVLWVMLARLLGLPAHIETVLLMAARVFAILAGTWSAWRMTDLICEALAYKAAQTETKIDDVLIPLLRKALKVFIVVFGLIYAALSLRLNIWPVLTGLGLGGVAFAFAAKDTIENFFGSVAVLLDRPFSVGDWVVIGDIEGTVEEIGFRSTRVRTFYNSQVTIPNSNLVRANVDNYGRRRYRRWKTYIGVQYDTPPEKLIAFTEGIRELVRTHPYTRKDYFQVYMNQFGPCSLDILLYVFHEVPDWSTELRERERLFIDIVRLADQLGVQFAFPTQTIHLYQEQHKPAETQHEIPRRAVDDRARTAGIRTAQHLVADQPWQESKPAAVTFTDGPTELAPEPPAEQPQDSVEQRKAGS